MLIYSLVTYIVIRKSLMRFVGVICSFLVLLKFPFARSRIELSHCFAQWIGPRPVKETWSHLKNGRVCWIIVSLRWLSDEPARLPCFSENRHAHSETHIKCMNEKSWQYKSIKCQEVVAITTILLRVCTHHMCCYLCFNAFIGRLRGCNGRWMLMMMQQAIATSFCDTQLTAKF